MKPKMTTEEATESFRIFLKQHDERLVHLMELGMIPEDIRITYLLKRQAVSEDATHVIYKEEIEVTLNQHKVRFINNTIAGIGEDQKNGTSILFLMEFSPGDAFAPRECSFSFVKLAESLAISEKEAELLSNLLLEEFNAFHQFFGIEEQQ